MLGGRFGLSLEAGLLTSPLGETPHLISLQFNWVVDFAILKTYVSYKNVPLGCDNFMNCHVKLKGCLCNISEISNYQAWILIVE